MLSGLLWQYALIEMIYGGPKLFSDEHFYGVNRCPQFSNPYFLHHHFASLSQASLALLLRVVMITLSIMGTHLRLIRRRIFLTKQTLKILKRQLTWLCGQPGMILLLVVLRAGNYRST